MPGSGEHQRLTAVTKNPFAESIPHINEYTAVEIATLQSRLDRQLGPEYISTRPGAGGGKVHYLAAEKVINLANEVFGFNGWSSEVRKCDIDFVDEHPETHKISLGLAVVMRVSLKDGTFHEDIGYGHIENCKGKAAAFEKARKEAVTDALKRALRSFGKVLGNCLYDKDYLARVSKVKVQPARWDETRLHRHPDYIHQVKLEAPDKPGRPNVSESTATSAARSAARQPDESQGTELEDDFGGGNLFDGVELGPDEVLVPADAADFSANNGSANTPWPHQHPHQQPHQLRPPSQPQSSVSIPPKVRPEPHQTPQVPIGNDQLIQDALPLAHVGFVTSRTAVRKDGELTASDIASMPRFNLNAESPSIRKTNGVDHNASAPVKRATLPGGGPPVLAPAGNVAAPQQQQPQPQSQFNPTIGVAGAPRNFVNPTLDPSRRVGMPGGAASPAVNRGAFKQPGPAGPAVAGTAGSKRPLPGDASPQRARTPLGDVSNTGGTGVKPEPAGGKMASRVSSSATVDDPSKKVRTSM